MPSIERSSIPSYRSPLRDDQAAATRDRILEAAHRLLGHIRPVDLAYARVAEEANVSVRTVYRHFPTPDDLFRALSDRLLGALNGGLGGVDPCDLASNKELLRRQYHMLAADPALYRVFFAVPTRSRHDPEAEMEGMFGERLAGLPPDARRIVFAAIDLLGSPYSWDVFHANWGLDGERAHQTAMFAMRAVLELALRSPELLAPGADPFPVPPKEQP